MPDPITYSTVSPRLGFPLLFAGQAQKENTINEALILLDLLAHGAVEGVRNAPPSSPVPGQMWLVDASPTADWGGRSGNLAGWTEGGWRFVVPRYGFRLQDKTTGQQHFFDGSWHVANAPSAATGGSVVDSEARAAISQLITALTSLGIF